MIGGVSFVGGIGKIRGVIVGVLMLRLIFIGLSMMSIDPNLQYLIKGGSFCSPARWICASIW